MFKSTHAMIIACDVLPYYVTVVQTGDDLSECCEGDYVILMCNHQSAMDIPIVAAVLSGVDKGIISRYYSWIMHKMFLYTHFGLVGQVRGDFFIDTVS
jgi:hypothetical protein